MANLQNTFEFWINSEKLPYLTNVGIDFEITNTNPSNNQSRIKCTLTSPDIADIFYAGVQNGIDVLSAEYRKTNLKTA